MLTIGHARVLETTRFQIPNGAISQVPRAFGSSQYKENEFVSLYDLVDTQGIVIYGRAFRLTVCPLPIWHT